MRSLPNSEPISYLDRASVRVAVLRARNLIAQGRSLDEAVRLACPGSWSQWRVLVHAQLQDHEAISSSEE
jgi:hypothetical protein